jgi:radical SAM family uncharacterized protein
VTKENSHHLTDDEIGTIRKRWQARIRVALVYPNHYPVAMSNLGFQTVYRLLNDMDQVACERAFLPEEDLPFDRPPVTLESGRSLREADIVAFSLSFENDYPHLLTILERAGIPLRSAERGQDHPLVVAGGIACWLNPEPIAPFLDCILVGEAEAILPRFVEVFEATRSRPEQLESIARNVPGAYVPAFYHTEYHQDGTIASFYPVQPDAPETIRRAFIQDLSGTATRSVVITPHTTFQKTFLIEVGRGCPHACRFCTAGYVYRPPRFRPIPLLLQHIHQALSVTDRVGLVGAAVSDLPGIDELCRQLADKDVRLSFSSLRADGLTPQLVAALKQGRVKTATIAPDAGSERMRRVINKGLSQEAILNAAETLVANGIPNLKLYFMLGLPTETEEDVAEIVRLCKQIKHRFLKSSRTRKRIGEITVTLSCFVPKPFTPFQWTAMAETAVLKDSIKAIKRDLKRVANLRVHSDMPRWAYVQGLLARGDRRVAEILALAHTNGGNWAQTLKSTPVNPDFYVVRERHPDEPLPWDFIDHGIRKSFLRKEYQRALQALPTAVCQVDSCDRCGVCQPKA